MIKKKVTEYYLAKTQRIQPVKCMMSRNGNDDRLYIINGGEITKKQCNMLG